MASEGGRVWGIGQLPRRGSWFYGESDEAFWEMKAVHMSGTGDSGCLPEGMAFCR
ncbi:MAG: hypothetical protein LBF74_10900 [Treponema sp.]|nr:hypothetical protein [Treponema sp.]